jgi:hypothetical protein
MDHLRYAGDHLRYAGRSPEEQRAALFHIARTDPLVSAALERARRLALPDWRLVSGALYNTVWNALTGRPSGYGIRDIDLFYFDPSDLSYEAEDAVIRKGAALFADLQAPVEIRNQARVHLWYPEKFGRPCPEYRSSDHAIEHFASRTHCVGLRLEEDGGLDLYAPYGLDDIFSFRLVPNRLLDNPETYAAKATRAKAAWPELTVVPW